MNSNNNITIYDDKVIVKRAVFTITIQPTDERDLEGCIIRAHELMKDAGIAKGNYSVDDSRGSVV